MTSDFIAEDDLNTFDEYLRLQGVDPSTAGPAVHALEYSGDHRAYHISLRERVWDAPGQLPYPETWRLAPNWRSCLA